MCTEKCETLEKIKEEIQQYKDALRVAADALAIASDWNIEEVELENVPDFLDLEIPLSNNMYGTLDLSQKLKILANKTSITEKFEQRKRATPVRLDMTKFD